MGEDELKGGEDGVVMVGAAYERITKEGTRNPRSLCIMKRHDIYFAYTFLFRETWSRNQGPLWMHPIALGSRVWAGGDRSFASHSRC